MHPRRGLLRKLCILSREDAMSRPASAVETLDAPADAFVASTSDSGVAMSGIEAGAGAVTAVNAVSVRRRWLTSFRRWVDTDSDPEDLGQKGNKIDWLRALPFIAMHAVCLCALRVGVSPAAVAVAFILYAVRMFALTGFYHRYFAHRTFRTSRTVQFIFAVIGASSVQRGPLWWAAHHRNHHRCADTELDPHSPSLTGFAWSHMGWFLTPNGFRTDWKRIPDLARFPELRWLDRFDILVPVVLGVSVWAFGALLEHVAPGLHTNRWQMLVWGFFVSTVVLFHATVTINSLAHRFGTRRYDTPDDSRNNPWLALITFGEGWHNNHHFYPGATRQGFRWWEFDVTWYCLLVLRACGLVRQLRPVPARVLDDTAAARASRRSIR
jgi:stearoyl-CoA desaturase (Delta-9 desaturase)